MKNNQIIGEIDYLLTTYCESCYLKDLFRKEKGKIAAHNFCIHSCTVGEEIREIGENLCSK
ncbi:zinc-finger domain-containing protein [Psychrobacillus sp. L3]|uniref:zinc-finger domain-containing protein n=1 Tax=Psychrobacillus sp. L3 TaxID=3236891 RepID=UPI0036F1BB98